MEWCGLAHCVLCGRVWSSHGVVWHIVFYVVEFGAVLEWCGLAHCILWGRVWSSPGVVWFGTLFSMG